jgi:hypothetical protein
MNSCGISLFIKAVRSICSGRTDGVLNIEGAVSLSVACSLGRIRGKYAPFNDDWRSDSWAINFVLVIDFIINFVISRVCFFTGCGGVFSYKNLIGEHYAFT